MLRRGGKYPCRKSRIRWGHKILEEHLKRVLGTPETLLIGINGVIGGGIFLLPGHVAALAGRYAVLAYLAAGMVAILIGLCFAEVSSMYTRTGGPIVYAEEAMGRTAGFAVGWMGWLTFVAGWGALSNGLVSYLSAVFPAGAPYGDIIIVGVIGALCALNTWGVRNGSIAVVFFSIAKLMPLLLLIAIGLLHGAAPAGSSALPVGHDFGKAVLMLIFAYGGFEMATIPAGEMVNPRQTIAVAVIGTLTAVTVVYMLIQFAAMRLDPTLASAKSPLAQAGGAMFAGGAVVMTVGATLSILGTKSGLALTAPRQLYALGRSRSLPAFVAMLYARRETPVVAIWTTGIVVMIAAVTGTFTTLILLNVAARLFEYAVVCLSTVILRFRAKQVPRPFRLPFGIVIPGIATIVCVMLLTQESVRQLVVALGALGVGLAFHLTTRWLAGVRQEP